MSYPANARLSFSADNDFVGKQISGNQGTIIVNYGPLGQSITSSLREWSLPKGLSISLNV